MRIFIVYVNDLLKVMRKDTILSYADDTVVLSEGENWSQTQFKMNAYLEKVSNWLALNKLSLNVQKCSLITFGNYVDSVPNTLDIKIQKQEIKRVYNCKYLRIYLDFNMKWNRHIEYIIN